MTTSVPLRESLPNVGPPARSLPDLGPPARSLPSVARPAQYGRVRPWSRAPDADLRRGRFQAPVLRHSGVPNVGPPSQPFPDVGLPAPRLPPGVSARRS